MRGRQDVLMTSWEITPFSAWQRIRASTAGVHEGYTLVHYTTIARLAWQVKQEKNGQVVLRPNEIAHEVTKYAFKASV